MIEVLKQALDALDNITDAIYINSVQEANAFEKSIEAMTSLRQAIREHAMYEVQRLGQEIEQEPVPTIEELEQEIYQNTRNFVSLDVMEWMLKRYYTHPPQRTWVGLTKDEVDSWNLPDHPTVFEFAQFIESKLKEKNI